MDVQQTDRPVCPCARCRSQAAALLLQQRKIGHAANVRRLCPSMTMMTMFPVYPPILGRIQKVLNTVKFY